MSELSKQAKTYPEIYVKADLRLKTWVPLETAQSEIETLKTAFYAKVRELDAEKAKVAVAKTMLNKIDCICFRHKVELSEALK